MKLTFITFLIASAHAQLPVCTSGLNIPAFAACARDALVDTSFQIGPTDITSACASLANDNGPYFHCLCNRAAALVNCYSIFCPADPVFSSARQSQTQYCDAAQRYPSPTLTTAIKTPDQGGAARTVSPTPTLGPDKVQVKNSGVIIQTVLPAIITFIIGLMI
jgi:hypothetical protein